MIAKSRGDRVSGREKTDGACVTRPGGRIVIGPDPDWETLVIDCSDADLLRRIKAFHSKLIANAGIAHELPAQMRQIGLQAVTVTPGTIVLTDLRAAEAMFALNSIVEHAQQDDAISDDDGSAWTHDLQTRDRAGDFFLSLTGFLNTAIR